MYRIWPLLASGRSSVGGLCHAAALVAWLCAPASAQSPPAARPAFDVASVKVNKYASGKEMSRTPGGLKATDYPFSSLLEMAYQIIDLCII